MYPKRISRNWNQEILCLIPLSFHLMALFSVVQSLTWKQQQQQQQLASFPA